MITVPGRIVLTAGLVISLTDGRDSDGDVFVNAELWEVLREGHVEGVAAGTGDHAATALIDLLLDMDAEGVAIPPDGMETLRGLAQSAIDLICASLTEPAP